MSDFVEYMGKMVPKNHFRVYVYNKDLDKKLCNNYSEYLVLRDTGVWFDSIEDAKAIEHMQTKTKKKGRPKLKGNDNDPNN
jgi:hypothetical protein